MLQSTDAHPTAEWIHDRLKKDLPGLSLATVYRNLHLLTEQEMIRNVDFAGNVERFDANTRPHYHFICERCGAIIDLDLPVDPELNDRVNRATALDVHRHRIEFFGVCARCAAKRGDDG